MNTVRRAAREIALQVVLGRPPGRQAADRATDLRKNLLDDDEIFEKFSRLRVVRKKRFGSN